MLTSSKSSKPAFSVSPVILEGGDPSALRKAALRLAADWMWDERKVLAGLHVDVSVLDNGEEAMIKVDEIRAIRRDMLLRPFDGEVKVSIIAHAHMMNANAQNALLRILEEPPPAARFILLTHNAAALLQTVRSRCAVVRVPPEALPEDEENESAEEFVNALDTPWRRMEIAASWDKLSRDALKKRLAAVLAALRNRCLEEGAKPLYVQTIQTVSELLPPLELNASSGSICGVLAVKGN
jgi:DNA polymerase III delta prime subunit